MRKIPRVRERTATPEELEEDRRRCLAAKAPAPKPEPTEGNLCACLVTFAAWRECSGCGARILFVNQQARTDSEFICGGCETFLARLQRGIQFFAAAASLVLLVLS